MARFRAYVSDSEEEEDVSMEVPPPQPEKPSREEDHNMEDDEVLVVARPNRIMNREPSDVEDDDDDDDDDDEESEEDEVDEELDDEDEDEDSEDDARGRTSAPYKSGPRDARGPPGDTTIIPWAREIGVDPQKMHVMQTSLFRMPEEERALKALNQPQSRKRLLLPSTLSRKHSRDSEGEGYRADSRQVRPAIMCPCSARLLKWRGFSARVVRARHRTRTVSPITEILARRKLCIRVFRL